MRQFLIFSIFLIMGLAPLTSYAQKRPATLASHAFMVDFDTGMVLYEKNPDMRMPTSSMSKVMTMYVIFEALKNGQISLNDEFLVSEKAWRKGGSKMFVEVDKSVRVEDLVRGVIVQSGNDATIVLAKGLAGTEEYFAKALTAKAKELGMSNSNFMNASGWPDPEHYSTPRDLATLGVAIIKNFPDYYGYYAEKEFTYNNITQRNRNPLLYRNIGADGIKTGHTDVGGYGLIGSGVHNGRRVVLVVNGLEDEQARAKESAKLLEWGLRGFQNVSLLKGDEPVAKIDVAMGKDDSIVAVTGRDLDITLPTLERQGLKIEVRMTEPLIAPIEKGQKIGMMSIHVPQLTTLDVPLLAVQDVPRMGLISRTFTKAKMLFFSRAQPKTETVATKKVLRAPEPMAKENNG